MTATATGNDPADQVVAGVTRSELTAWVVAACAGQGVPVTVTDPATLAKIATLLGRTPARAAAER